MADIHKTALFLEEQASRLSPNSERRARLLALAKGMRQIALEEGEFTLDDGPPATAEEPEFMMVNFNAHGFNEMVLRRRAREAAKAEGRSVVEVLDELRAQHLAELKRELAATAPTDPEFERRVSEVEDYADFCAMRRGKL